MSRFVVWEAHLGCRTEHVLEKPAAIKSEMVVTWTTQWHSTGIRLMLQKHFGSIEFSGSKKWPICQGLAVVNRPENNSIRAWRRKRSGKLLIQKLVQEEVKCGLQGGALRRWWTISRKRWYISLMSWWFLTFFYRKFNIFYLSIPLHRLPSRKII